MVSIEPRVIEDSGDNAYSDVSNRKLNDDDKLQRLEENLQKVKEMSHAGDETSKAKDKKRSKKQKTKSDSDKPESEVVYAPGIDEVTADNDHLASLRGEGRYFGVTDPDVNQPVCSNCHRRGHKRSQCKVVVCHACGKVDDHYETQCPNSMVCSNCGERGHFRNNCPSKRQQTYCVECDSTNHSTDRCPSIWRSYVLKRADKNTKIAYPSSMIFCYNCAAKGHYGDDCRDMRVSKTPNINGSAFSGENLPKQLISQYKNLQNRESSFYGDNNRKRKFATDNSTNYNYAPPPYPRFNRNNNSNSRNYQQNNNNNNYNNNYNISNNENRNRNVPQGPSKVGYIPMRNNTQNQRRNQNNNYTNSNKNNYGNNNNLRSSYLNNNNNNFRGSDYNNRNSYKRRY